MTAPISPRELAALEKLVARLRDGGEAKPRRAPCAARARQLSRDGLDNAAIASALGASIAAVSMAVSRMRRRDGLPARRGRGAPAELLVALGAEARGRLAVEARRLGIAPGELAGRLIEAGLMTADRGEAR